MRNRLFAIVALAILISQPLILTSSIAMLPAAEISNSNSITTAQDHGTRLAPNEHTDHVAILIDESTDFTSQGWPGEGTENDPFIIAGLNITYGIGVPLIRIFNVDDYFVIEDCFVKQLSSVYAIHMENVTCATVRYTTAMSPYGTLQCINTTGAIAQNLLLEAGNKYGLYVTNSEGFELSESLVNISSYEGVYLNGSDLSIISDSIIDAPSPYFDIEVRYSDNVSIIDTEFHAAAIEVYVYRCAYFYGDGITSSEGVVGMYLSLCNYTEIVNTEMTSTNEALMVYDCKDLSISDSYFSSPTSSQEIIDIDLSDNVIFDNVHFNDTLGDACDISLSNITFLNSLFTNLNKGITLSSSHDVQIQECTFENINDEGVYLNSAHRANISDCVFSDSGYGVLGFQSDNATILWNDFTEVASGVSCEDCEMWDIHDNAFRDSNYGIGMLGGSRFDIWYNTFTNLSSSGIYAEDNDVLEVWECIFSDCANAGLELYDCDDQYLRDLTISNSEDGIFLDGTVNSTFNDNIISDCIYGITLLDVVTSEFNGNNISYCEDVGIDIYSADYCTFIDNNMIECGFLLLIEPLDVQLYNHSFSGNTVNGKPVYYAFNETNLVINGSLFGQIIVANCTEVSITEGEFVQATCGIQVMFSNNVDIADVYLGYQYMAAFALVCENVTFVDSTISGTSEDYGIFLYQVQGVWIHNTNFTGVGGYWFGIPSGIYISYFLDVAISSCNFYDIEGIGVGLEYGTYGKVEHCNSYNVSAGIYADSVNLLNATYNDFKWSEVAIYTTSCDDWIVTDNYLHDGYVGLYRSQSDDWYTANNTIMWNYLGMVFEGSGTPGITADNIIAANIEQNGDDDVFRYWDDGVDTGNYWGDYSGTGTYTVGGSAGSIDRYPMKYLVTEPLINSPIDIWIAEGSEGNEILWLPFDNNLKNWEAEMDGSLWASGSWNFDNITVNIDGLTYGTHTIVITVWDLDLNSVSDAVIIHVYDDTPPEIDGPPNQWLFVDATGQTIEWEVSDLNPDTYTLTVDDVEFDSGTWMSGILSLDVDDIDEGEHTLVLTIYDVDGNSISDTVLVRVIDDNTNPVIDEAEDVIYVEGTIGNTLDWSAEDDYPAAYEISFNGTVLEEGAWGGSDIIFNVDGLTPGIYEYTLMVYDYSGNSASSSANVTVLPLVPTEPPLLIDWVVLLIVGAVAGGAVVVVVLIYYHRKNQTS